MLLVRSDLLQPCPGAVDASEGKRDADFSYGMFGPTPYCIKHSLVQRMLQVNSGLPMAARQPRNKLNTLEPTLTMGHLLCRFLS